MEENVLNGNLYYRLKQVFKDVEILNENIAPRIKMLDKAKYSREWEFEPDSAGELYRVDCPICGDTKKHCYISSLSYTCPKIGDITLSRSPLIVTCFRRNCFKGNPENRKKISAAIEGDINIDMECSAEQSLFGNSLVLEDHLHVNSDNTILKWSPDYHPVTNDAPSEVLDYIDKRGIGWRDIQELKIGWGKCWNHKNKSFIGNNNWLQFPIFDQAGFRGMQSRQLCEGCNMKYFFDTRTPKSMVLYNRQRASKYDIVAICEGIIDALHIGRCGMAFFGSRPSAPQIKLLQQDGAKMVLYLPDQKKHYTKEGVCDLDPGAIADEYIKEWNKEKLFDWGAYRIDVPREDAGACTKTEIWLAALSQLACKVDDALLDRLVSQVEDM